MLKSDQTLTYCQTLAGGSGHRVEYRPISNPDPVRTAGADVTTEIQKAIPTMYVCLSMFVRETKTPASLLRRDDASLSTHAQVFLLDTQTVRKKFGRKKGDDYAGSSNRQLLCGKMDVLAAP